MPRVSDHYHLGLGPFEFLDLQVQKDTRLFIDPSAIRRGTDAYSRRADAVLLEFFTEILRCARSSGTADHAKGLRLLRSLHEPNETRLGYSRAGSRGHAFSDGMGQELWDAIVANRTLRSSVRPGASASVQQAVMSRLEDVPLFIDRVDKDMISDLATRVAYSVLVDFTHDMMTKYPSIVASSNIHEREVWDSPTLDLVEKRYRLPKPGSGHHLILVPRWWIDKRLIMNPTAFYNRYAIGVLQDETKRIQPNGRVQKQTKKSIKAVHPDIKRTNATEAVRHAENHGRDLVGEYRRWTDGNVASISDLDIERRL